MYRFAAATAALLASTAIAQAGGLDRNQTTTSILFESGTYVELGYTNVSPSVSGALASNGTPSGDISPSFGYATLGYHHDINDTLSFSLIVDAPYGADVSYPGRVATTGYPFAGSRAEVRSQQVTAALRYQLTDSVSAYGGIRALRLQGEADVSAATSTAGGFNYTLRAESDWEYGYMLGAAYEIPEIAMRVALTYFSDIEATLTGTEGAATVGLAALNQPVPAANISPTSFKVTMPQSVLLEAQSGIAEGTLLFGSVRWTDWEGFQIRPNRYPAGSLVSYTDDVWTWNIGIGRRVTEELALSATLGYEAEQDGFSGNLGPTDGRLSIGLGAEYTVGAMSIAGGIQYSMIGDAQTANAANTLLANFNNNDALAVGIRIGYQF
ncbi:MAG: OmpP1/FadL family transporter [Roseicyclus sp.]|uniref:OmpP1/FadL family transporter n=1 Tax=Roseicyclus sp. TaxID=1914329 RepID=UPI003A88F16F